MIVTFVVAAAVIVFIGSFAWDRLRRRRHRALASRTQHGPTMVDGVASPAAAEALMRGGYHGQEGGAGGF